VLAAPMAGGDANAAKAARARIKERLAALDQVAAALYS